MFCLYSPFSDWQLRNLGWFLLQMLQHLAQFDQPLVSEEVQTCLHGLLFQEQVREDGFKYYFADGVVYI